MDRRGFTLIELLVAIGIMLALMGMLMPVYAIARTYADKTNTQAQLRKIDTALRLFKTDTRVFPWDCNLQPAQIGGAANPAFNVSYPDVRATIPAWSNRLAYHLATAYNATTAANITADADAARNAFNYDLSNNDGSGNPYINNDSQGNSITPVENPSGYSIMCYRASDELPYSFTGTTPNKQSGPSGATGAIGLAAYLNRLAQERYPLAMIAGAVNITGPKLKTVYGPTGTAYTSANPNAGTRATTKLIASPASAASPGWSDNYLAGELEAWTVQGDTIMDVWGNPLIYVCQVLPGCKPALAKPFIGSGYVLRYIDPGNYGLAASGRRSLAPYDNYTQQALAADTATDPDTGAARLPDPANPYASDIRYYAGDNFTMEPELWSAGRNGKFAWRRDDAVNSDNIPARNYLQGMR